MCIHKNENINNWLYMNSSDFDIRMLTKRWSKAIEYANGAYELFTSYIVHNIRLYSPIKII